MTLYEMIFGQLPFTHSKNDENIDRQQAEEYFRGKGYKINYEADEEEAPIKIIKILKKMLLPEDRITWKELKKELIFQYKVPEHMFMNISEVVDYFIPITELFLRVQKIIKEKSTSSASFWKTNSQFLTHLG